MELNENSLPPNKEADVVTDTINKVLNPPAGNGTEDSLFVPDTSKTLKQLTGIDNLQNQEVTDKVTTPNLTTESNINQPDYVLPFLNPSGVSSGANRNIALKKSDYSPYINMDVIGDVSKLDFTRANAQSGGQQFRNMLGRIITNIAPEILKQTSTLFDSASFEEGENEFYSEMSKYQEYMNSQMPIHRTDPNKPLDYGDSGYWFDNGASMVTSIAGFAGSSYLTGFGLSKILQGLSLGTKSLLGAKTVGTAAQTLNQGKAITTLTTLGTTIASNHAEGYGVALDTYNNVYQKTLELLADNNSMTDEEKDIVAKTKASDAASTAYNINRSNILLNLTSVSKILNQGYKTNALLSKRNLLKDVIVEGGQEYLEETINMIAQNAGESDYYSFSKAVDDALTKEGFESGILGFIGGSGMVGGIGIKNKIPTRANIAYQNAYRATYDNEIKKGTSTTNADKIAHERALKIAGTDKKRVSANYLYDLRYNQQQAQIEENQNGINVKKATDSAAAFMTFDEIIKLQQDLKKAKDNGDTVAYENLSRTLLEVQAFNNFELGTTKSLIEMYEAFGKLTEDEAKEKGLAENYKEIATESVNTIKQLEKEYNRSLAFVNPFEVYEANAKLYTLRKQEDKFTNSIKELMTKSREMYKDNESVGLAEVPDTLSYVDVENWLFLSTDNYKSSKEAQEIKLLNALRNNTIQKRKDAQKEKLNLESDKYQKEYVDSYKRKVEQEKKEQKEKDSKLKKDSTINKAFNKIKRKGKKSTSTGEVPGAVEPNVTQTPPTPETPPVDPNAVSTAKPDTITTTTEDKVEIPQGRDIFNTITEVTVKAIADTIVNETDTYSSLSEQAREVADKRLNARINAYEKRIKEYDSAPHYAKDQEDLKQQNEENKAFLAQFYEERKQRELAKSANTLPQEVREGLNSFMNGVDQVDTTPEDKTDSSPLIEDDIDNVEENLSPVNQEKRDYAKQQLLNLADIVEGLLPSLAEAGVDFNDFRQFITLLESVVGQAKVRNTHNFNKLKIIYNYMNMSNPDLYVEGTYNEIMNPAIASSDLQKRARLLEHSSIPQGVMYPQLDNIGNEAMSLLADIAKAQGIDFDGLDVDIKKFNITGSNLLAYLARFYDFKVKQKKGEGGYYIEITKQDLSNEINSNLDERVLDPDFLKEGTEIEFVVLDSIVEQDGTIRTAVDSSLDNVPIGIKVNGEVIKGLYLHDTSWINNTNVEGIHNGSPEAVAQAIQKDREELRLLRAITIANHKQGKQVKTSIVSRTPGVPIMDASKQLKPVAESLPDVEIGVVRNKQVEVSAGQTTYNTINSNMREGKVVALVPYGDKQLALPLKTGKVSEEVTDSIISAINIFINKNNPEVVKQIKEQTGHNINTLKGLKDYLSSFIYFSDTKTSDLDTFSSYLGTINNETVPIFEFKNGVLRFGMGMAQNIGEIILKGDNSNNSEYIKGELVKLRQQLAQTFYNIDLARMGVDNIASQSNTVVIKGNSTEVLYTNYNDFVKANTYSPYLSHTLSNGKTIYTIQGRIHFNTNQVLEQNQQTVNSLKDKIDFKEDTTLDNISDEVQGTTPYRLEINETQNETTDDFDELLENTDGLDLSPVILGEEIKLTKKQMSEELRISLPATSISNDTIINIRRRAKIYNEGNPDVHYQVYTEPDNRPGTSPLSYKIIVKKYNVGSKAAEERRNSTGSQIRLDLSPVLSENFAEEIANELNLIEGVEFRVLDNIINNILYNSYIIASSNPGMHINASVEVNRFLNTLLPLRDKYRASNKPAALKVADIIDKLIENKGKIIKEVGNHLLKRDSVKETVEDEALLLLEEDSELEIFEEADVENTRSWLDTAEYTIDPRTRITQEVKDFLDGVTEYNKDGKPKITVFGIPQLVPFDTVFNVLKRVLSNSNTNLQIVNEANIISILEDNIKQYPFLRDVANKLNNASPEFKYNFINALNLQHTNHTYVAKVTDKETGDIRYIPISASSKNITDLILSEWQQGLMSKVYFDRANGTTIFKESVVTDFINAMNNAYKTQNRNDLHNALNMIGINLPLDLLNEFYDGNVLSRGAALTYKEQFTSANGYFKLIVNAVKEAKEKLNKETNKNNSDSVSLFTDNIFKKLAYLASKHRDDLFIENFKNGNGDTVHSYQRTKVLIDKFLRLKGDTSFSYLLDIPFTQDSLWLNNLYGKMNGKPFIKTNDVFYKYFQYFTADSFKLDNNEKGTPIDKLTAKQFEEYKLSLFFNQGMSSGKKAITQVPFLTMSDKSTIIGFQFPREHFKLGANGDISEAAYRYLVKQLFTPEINRILSEQVKKDKVDNSAYDKGRLKFLLFPQLNEEHSPELYENGLLKADILENFDDVLLLKMKEYLRAEIRNQIDKWKTEGILYKDGKETKIIGVDENYKTKFGNNPKEILINFVTTNLIANMNYIQMFMGDPAFLYKGGGNSLLDSMNTFDAVGKRLSLQNAGGDRILEVEGERNTVNYLVIKDKEETSTAIDYLNKLWGKDSEVSKLYSEINIGDAAEFISAEHYLEILVRTKLLSRKDKDRLLEKDNKGQLTEKDIAILRQPLGAMKPVYGTNFLKDGVDYQLYVKSASIPLFKSLTKGLPIDNLRKIMNSPKEKDNKIDRVAFESAVKKGKPNTIVEMFNDDGTVNENADISKSVIKNVPISGLYIQQETPFKETKTEVNDGTQQSHILFNALLDIDGFIDPETGENVTGKQLKDKYDKYYEERFKIAYNKLVKDLQFNVNSGTINNLNSLHKLLVKEGIARNYSINDLAAFNLNELATNFAYPLYLHSADSKINALLCSIVDNDIRKRKVRGESFVLLSEAGFKMQSQEDVSLSNITPLGDWDGTLKSSTEVDKEGNKTITYAEVLVPFNFKDNEGNTLNIKDFTKVDEKGNTILDTTKLPEKLLESFGYRIPTQGLNSTSLIKIVGFLPQTYQGVIVASKDFVTQMGSDFDVDKLYSHLFNTYVTEKGELKIINESTKLEREENKKKKGKLLNEITNLQDRGSNKNRIIEIKKELDALNTKRNNKEISPKEHKDLTRPLELEKNRLRELENDRPDIEDLLKKVKDIEKNPIMSITKFDTKILDNKILDIHFAILSNPNPMVQRQRTNPVSFGKLLYNKGNSGLKIEMQKIKEANKPYWTPLSSVHQSYKYLNARAGKTAVSNFALDNVFMSIIQDVDGEVNFLTRKGKPIKVNIAGKWSTPLNYKWANNNGLDGKPRLKSDITSAFLSMAVDNENEQGLGVLGINTYTYDFIRTMIGFGYDEDLIIRFINQPKVVEYINAQINRATYKVPEFDKEYSSVIRSLTLEQLDNYIKSNDSSDFTQDAILYTFIDLTNKGKKLKTAQSTLNVDSSGVGKNLFYSLAKVNQLVKLRDLEGDVTGITQLVGDFYDTSVDRGKDLKQLKEEGYLHIKDSLYIKPRTIKGSAMVYGAVTNAKMWSYFYPYLKGNLNKMLNNIALFSNIKIDSLEQEAKLIKDITTSYKEYINSATTGILSDKTMRDLRQELLYDNNEEGNEHMSLGSIIAKIKNENLYNNPIILDRLQVGKGNVVNNGAFPLEIKYINAGVYETNQALIIKSFVDMIINPKQIGEFNGKVWTSKDLAENLVLHQLVTGGVQKATQFIKHIPVQYLKELGYYDLMNSLYNSIENNYEGVSDTFITQFIQHNPEMFWSYNKEQSVIFNEDGLPTSENDDKFIVIKGNNSSEFGNYRVFKKGGFMNGYIEIDLLGYKGQSEYDMSATFAPRSLVFMQQVNDDYSWLNQDSTSTGEVQGTESVEVKEDLSPTTESIPNTVEDIRNFYSLKENKPSNTPKVYSSDSDYNNLLDTINNTELDSESIYNILLKAISDNSDNKIAAYFAQELLAITGLLSNVPIVINETVNAKGILQTINGKPSGIVINPNNIKDTQELYAVILEEIVHAVTAEDVNNGTESTVKVIDSLRQSVISHLNSKNLHKTNEILDRVREKLKKGKPLTREEALYYNLLNNQEFIAAAIKDKAFQKLLSSIESSNKQTLWDKFLNLIKDILVNLGVKDNNVLHDVLSNTLSLLSDIAVKDINIQVEKKYNRTVNTIIDKFKLVDSNGNLLPKSNANEIVDFINKTNNLVEAKVVDGNKVQIISKTFTKKFGKDFSPLLNGDSKVNYTLKAVNLLQSDKAKQIFDKGVKNNWKLDKVLDEIGGFGNRTGYRELFTQEQLNSSVKNLDRDQLVLDIVSNYSYTIEINTAKEKLQDYEMVDETGEGDFQPQEFIPDTVLITEEDEDGNVIGVKEVLSEEGKKQIEERENRRKPTQHHSGLTVPGGTNYTENAIQTPDIINISTAHIYEFAEGIANMLGWFRSDDAISKSEEKSREQTMLNSTQFEEGTGEDDWGMKVTTTSDELAKIKNEPTKTRRILEVQSDLFQNGRDKELLVESKTQQRNGVGSIPYRTTGEYAGLLDKIRAKANEVLGESRGERPDGQTINLDGNTYYTMNGMWYLQEKELKNENQFLQLLNKDNNWVTFFVKSIIQDSAKKGYEKVLFPKGDTAAKIEGHETLEVFKKQTEDKIKELEERQEKLDRDLDQGVYGMDTSEYDASSDNINRELDRLEQELADVESGKTQLSSIANFYETAVTNILKKQGYNPVEITDEYGNKWNEIELTEEVINEELNLSVVIDDQTPESLVPYLQSIELRLDKIKESIDIAEAQGDINRVLKLEEQLNKTQDIYDNVIGIESLTELANQAYEDLDLVDEILNTSMSDSDIVYALQIINFWKNSKDKLFSDMNRTSKPLIDIYGDIENKFSVRHNQVIGIAKKYLNGWVNEHTGLTDYDVDKEFDKFVDITSIDSHLDISRMGNDLLYSIWAAVKEAKRLALDETQEIVTVIDNELDKVQDTLISNSTDKHNRFEIFRQKTKEGKYTGNKISPYVYEFYKRLSGILSKLNNDNNYETFSDYVDFVKEVGDYINLSELFPIDGNVTEEIEQRRNTLRTKYGKGTFNLYLQSQERKLKNYHNRREHYISNLLSEYNVQTEEELKNIQDGYNRLFMWERTNSPYELEKQIFKEDVNSLKNYKHFNSHKYFEVLINPDSDYKDKTFNTIENNEKLLEFYLFIDKTLKEFKQYIPAHQRSQLSYDGLPYIEKTIYQMYSEHGMQLGFAPIKDAILKANTSSFASETVGIFDPVTEKIKQRMRVDGIGNRYNEIQREVDIRTNRYFVENGAYPSPFELNAIKEEVVHEFSQDQDFDLGRIAKMMSVLVLAHKHKARIEDSVNIAKTVLSTLKEVERQADGTSITYAGTGIISEKPANDSFVKTKALVDNYVDAMFYGKKKEEERKGKKKKYTSEERSQINELIEQEKELKDKLDKEEINQQEYDDAISAIDSIKNNMGRAIVGSKVGDSALQYLQLKLMGWNILGAISNLGFGFMSNIIEGAGGQLYTTKDLWKAYSLTLNSVGKNFSFNYKTGLYKDKVANKIRAGMDKFDVLSTSNNEIMEKKSFNNVNKRVKWLQPLQANERTEYINQAPIFIAVAKNWKILTSKGEVSIWEAVDDNFNWNVAEYGEVPTAELTKFSIRVDSIVKRNHGNYDSESHLAIKNKFIGRAYSQFRTWIYESINARFGGERVDRGLGITVKGRYISLWNVATKSVEDGNKLLFAKEMLAEIIKTASFNTLKIGGFKGMEGVGTSETDIANLKRMAMEIVLLLELVGAYSLLALGKGDDDDEDAWVYNILLNQTTRLTTDLTFYFNPSEGRQMLKDLIPVSSLVDDAVNIISAFTYLIQGEDEIKNGVHAGNSRTITAFLKAMPFGSKVYSVYNASSQEFRK